MGNIKKVAITLGLLVLYVVGYGQDIEKIDEDSCRLEKAFITLESYTLNDSLRQALRILKKHIKKERKTRAIEQLTKAPKKDLSKYNTKYVDSLLCLFKNNENYKWFRELTKDSLQLNIFDTEGNQKKIWINTPRMHSTRYWIYKSPTDSLGFWVHSLPEKGIILEPDFDIIQEGHHKNERVALLQAIPIKENPEAYKLVTFMKYPRILTYWKKGIVANIGFSQTYFDNWVKGGENNIAIHNDILAFINYKSTNVEWENYLRWKYGLIHSEKYDELIRNEDVLELNSKYGIKASKKWYYSTQLNIKTQLFDGFSYKEGIKSKVSDFLSPGYISLALGMDYKPTKHLSLLFSPVSGRLSYMRDIKDLDETTYGIKKGKHLWGQLGSYFRLKWNDKLFSSVNINTSLELFSDYFNKATNIDLDWSTSIDMKINYFMSTRLTFQMIYDDDVEIPLYDIVNGKKVKIGSGQRLQFNENLSLGLVLKI